MGVPQLTAVYDVARPLRAAEFLLSPTAHTLQWRYSETLAAGATSVMLGGMLAGVEESPATPLSSTAENIRPIAAWVRWKPWRKVRRTVTSRGENDVKKLVPEGIAARVPYKRQHLRSGVPDAWRPACGMGYCGARTIDDLHHAQFCAHHQRLVAESHPHDVAITSEAPNYSTGNH